MVPFHIMVELVAREAELFHRFRHGIIHGFFRLGNPFGNVHMFFRVIYHNALFLLGDSVLVGKGVDGRQGHVELFLHFLRAIPFGDVRVWGFLGKVGIYMFLAPIGFTAIEGTWDAVLFGNGEYPRFIDMIFLFDFGGGVEVGDGCFFYWYSLFILRSIFKQKFYIFSSD